MADRSHNTTPATHKEAPNHSPNQSHFECANQSSHGARNNCRNSRRISHFPKINSHKFAWSSHSSLATGISTVRCWDYSQMPSNRTPRKSLKTFDRKIFYSQKIPFFYFRHVFAFWCWVRFFARLPWAQPKGHSPLACP